MKGTRQAACIRQNTPSAVLTYAGYLYPYTSLPMVHGFRLVCKCYTTLTALINGTRGARRSTHIDFASAQMSLKFISSVKTGVTIATNIVVTHHYFLDIEMDS